MTASGHICAPDAGFRLLEHQPDSMVDTDRIREEGLTTDEVIDREFVGPHDTPTEAHWPEYFDDYPEEQPGDEAWLDETEDGEPVLCWEDGDFSVRLRCIEWGDWEARITVPEDVGRHIPKPTPFKAHNPPTIGDSPVGYVDVIEYPDDGYTAETVVLRLAEAEGMPIVAPSSYVDTLREYAKDSEEYLSEVDDMLAAARENEEQQKRVKIPGMSEEGLTCPHCKETVQHVVKRDDGGFDCVHCREPVDKWVKSAEAED